MSHHGTCVFYVYYQWGSLENKLFVKDWLRGSAPSSAVVQWAKFALLLVLQQRLTGLSRLLVDHRAKLMAAMANASDASCVRSVFFSQTL
jgi:hypothetical protein